MLLELVGKVIELPQKIWNRHVKTIAAAHRIAKAFRCEIIGVPKKVKLKNGRWGYQVRFQKLKKKKGDR